MKCVPCCAGMLLKVDEVSTAPVLLTERCLPSTPSIYIKRPKILLVVGLDTAFIALSQKGNQASREFPKMVMLRTKRKARQYSRKGNYKRRKIQTPKKKWLNRVVKSIVNRQSETKKKFMNLFANDSNANYNFEVLYNFNPLYAIGQGTGDDQRIGDKIFVKGFRMKMRVLSTGSLQSPVYARIFLFKSNARTAGGSALNGYQRWFTSSEPAIKLSNGHAASAIYDTEKNPIIWQKTYKMNFNSMAGGTTSSASSRELNIDKYFSMNKSIQFDANNSGYLKYQNYYFGLVLSQQGKNSLDVTPVDCYFTCYYKDF